VTIDTTSTITAEIEAIDPRIAAQHLSHNLKNRNIRTWIVARYAHDMRSGNWRMAGEPIKFAHDGTLLDGQHRLEAVIDSDTTQSFLVVRGLPNESQQVMDSGASRLLSGQLQIAGHPNASRLASTARLAYLFENGLLFKDTAKIGAVTNSDLINFIDLNPDLHDAVATMPGKTRKRNRIDANPATICCFTWITRRTSPDASAEFLTLLATRAGLPEDSPILALDSRLRELSRVKAHITGPTSLSLFVRAWNAWRLGKPLRRLATHWNGAIVQFESVAP
jgi:hypothetical protein